MEQSKDNIPCEALWMYHCECVSKRISSGQAEIEQGRPLWCFQFELAQPLDIAIQHHVSDHKKNHYFNFFLAIIMAFEFVTAELLVISILSKFSRLHLVLSFTFGLTK